MKQPEGIMKKFADIYNDGLIIGHIANKSLRGKLERLRAQMGVDFYNLRWQEDLEEFAGKYMPYKATYTFPEKGTQIKMENIFAGLALGFDMETKEYRDLNMFKTIVDKILDGAELTAAELSHVNARYCGKVSQTRQKDGKWRLRRSVYFLNYGIIYRALYDFVIQVSIGRIDVTRCEALGCKQLFLQKGGGSSRRFCSSACKMRAYRRRQKEKPAEI